MDKTSTFKRVQTVHYPGQCTEKKRKKKKKTRESAFVSSLTLATRHRFLVWCWKVEGGTNWRGWLAFCFELHSAGCAYLAAQHGAKLHCNIAIKAEERREEVEGGMEEREESEDEREGSPFGRTVEERRRKKRGAGGREGEMWRGPKGYSS